MSRALLIAALLLVGCEAADHPNRPLPSDFEARLMDGGTLTAADFQGSPWVVELWVPG